MDQYIGKMLEDRYELLEEIGSGGMAYVYKAKCHRLNRYVAVKILKEELSKDAEFRRRFHAESQAVAMLSHPNIVSVYDVSHTDDCDYIVMELIDGITLKQYLEQKGKLNWREALHFGTQIGKALEHAHSRGIIHRDIKPHNIMLLKDGSVKVADFGIARVTSAQSTLTREALGSVHYISPEQAKGGSIDCRSDLYSLGVVMYEMLTGRPPYDGDTPVSVAIQHINAKPTMPREIEPSIPEGLEQITMHAMEADLSKRYATASEMLADLDAFRKNPAMTFGTAQTRESAQPEPQPKPKKAEPVQEKKKKSKLPMILGILAIVAAVVGLAALLIGMLGDSLQPGEDIKVPELLGEPAESLQEKYEGDFVIEIGEWVYSDTPYGCVVSQDPKGGKTVKRGSTVTVTASLGAETMTMPNLINYNVREAQNILENFSADLLVTVSYEDSDIYVEDYVIRTTPSYGAPLASGDSVELVVSLGAAQELISVPELVGRDVEDALKEIDRVGLSRGTIKYVASDLPKDTVTFQSLPQGTEVKEETVINLQVSEGELITAQLPTITMQPAALTVEQGTTAALSASATVTDGGTLNYEWFVVGADAQPVGTGAVLTVPTDTVGSRSYYCRITNTLEDSSVSVNSGTAQVTVTEKIEPVTKVLELAIPSGEGTATIVVKLDGDNYTAPFTVSRSESPIQIAVESTGRHIVDVYVDGLLTLSKTVTFTP
ncbi:MAG: Stk1 family PASTA domain-containing Ser/Thr kinase [Oscillospiraceae bacterium]|nr:Stk1 family PASTA domain-containing Ser/Thr kinase [Oscillospiraceae bacterium]